MFIELILIIILFLSTGCVGCTGYKSSTESNNCYCIDIIDYYKCKGVCESVFSPKYNIFTSYEGELSVNTHLPDGFGTVSLDNGDKYYLKWLDGKLVFNSNSKLTYANGNVYEGYFNIVNNQINYVYGFIGNWKSTMTYFDGSQYKGFWHNNKRHGDGKMTYILGNEYVGTWNNDKKHGIGQMKFSNNDIYNGIWVDDKIQGTGTMVFADGSSYTGNWVDGKRHGFGTMKFSNGSVYKGNWLNGMEHGEGTYYVYLTWYQPFLIITM
jgi:hypothetical protein